MCTNLRFALSAGQPDSTNRNRSQNRPVPGNFAQESKELRPTILQPRPAWTRALRMLEVRAAGLLRLPVLVSQCEVELQHVDELLTEEPADRRVRIRSDHLFDLDAHLRLIALGVLGPG